MRNSLRAGTLVLALLCPYPARPARANTISVTLHWTAPGDDSTTGRASRYELRYANEPITAATFAQATLVTGLPAPKMAGSAESFTVTGLWPSLLYFFALKTYDERNNCSALSNIAYHAGSNVGVGDDPTATWFSPPWPNPAHDQARWSYALAAPGPLDVEVFDVTGHRVRTLARGAHEAGRGELRWDLRDDDGRPVSAGAYFVRARLAGLEWSRRVAVVR